MTLQHPKSSISNPSFLYLSSVSKNVAFVSGPRYWNRENICRAIQKCVIRHMWTVKAQIRLRICAVWSGPSLSTNTIIGYYKMYELRAKNKILWTCAEWSETVYFVHIWRHFLLDMGHTLSVTALSVIPCLFKQCRSRSIGFFDWSGPALFVIQYVNLYQQSEFK